MYALTKTKSEVKNVKNIRRKLGAVALAAVLMIISLSGCGVGKTSSDGSISTIEKGVLKVGMNFR